MKLIFFIILIFSISISNGLKDNESCTSYINNKSTYIQIPCGQSLNTACPSFTLAIESSTSYTSVVFDLNGATNTFFNIDCNSSNNTNSTINVSGITFVNGYQENQASILVNHGTSSVVSFNRCVFNNVTSKGGFDINGKSTSMGGALSLLMLSTINTAFLQSSKVSFISCTYQNSNIIGVKGGFLYVARGIDIAVSINQCVFRNITGDAGAIIYTVGNYLEQTYTMYNTIISNCNFKESAVYMSASFSASNVTFTNNIGGGVGLYLSGAKLYTISNSNFTNNSNISSVYVSASYIGPQFKNCIFSNNSNTYSNNSSGSITLSSSGAIFQRCEFKNNNANNGAAIYASGKYIGQSISLEDTLLSRNKAIYNGGSIYLSNSILIVSENTTFDNNMANLGSVVFCNGSQIQIFNSSSIVFNDNTDFSTNNSKESSNGITCKIGGVNSCSIKGNLEKLEIYGVTGNTNSEDSENKDYGLPAALKAVVIITIVCGFILITSFSIFLVRRLREIKRYKPIDF
ncbi:hypothetical protein DICPUDRAFT_75062 [Dictyostelium purpureum]|uniref:Right handed beta helix domain-containing protein n=1 Tax=Dictyostelium purpureum TaxID=5786 RepID=F0Z9I9_DICPU|nr:uncharacterized protein DICPUDRAFT_75062 [Dictyostelium purpureum]EGC39417.1 hypothetical protein DICPUDRAFT_75062 [Dictyostelium purpureum]|eukprot:XP_003284091.1 hypothetical protein DICPUDRAFT_75062 [Dictyostelium purpureum]